MQYFNQGTKVLVHLAATDLFKAYYKLHPGEVQSLQAFIAMPWAFKVVYGLISDTIPIFGSRRKSYLIFFAMLQSVTMVVLGMHAT